MLGENRQVREPDNFFRQYVGLNDDQVDAIKTGRAIAKIVESRTPDEVFVFGVVYVKSTPKRYLRLAGDVAELRKLPSYLAIREFSDPPQLSDLDRFTLEAEDVRQLKNCKPGKCEVQLPAESMEEFQRSVNWSTPDAAEQVNRAAQKMALQALLGYQQGGNAALGTYRDKSHPTEVAETVRSLLSRSKALPAYLPGLSKGEIGGSPNPILLGKGKFRAQANATNCPSDYLPWVESCRAGVCSSSQAALLKPPLSDCVGSYRLRAGFGNADQGGFYLITLKGSQQAGLTGLKGSIVRKVAVDKTRSSLERALATIKERLENETE
jgi:hypothetical protein